MKTLVFDTETSGMIIRGAHERDPRQPHIVSFAALVLDDSLEEIECRSAIIQQDGWTSEPGALSVHGITQDRSMTDGIPEKEASEILLSLITEAGTVVAHNIAFDSFIVKVALFRYGLLEDKEKIESKAVFCTMLGSMNLCKIPGRYEDEYKWPKLKEACSILLGETVQEGNHDALEDVRSCASLYRWLWNNGHVHKREAR